MSLCPPFASLASYPSLFHLLIHFIRAVRRVTSILTCSAMHSQIVVSVIIRCVHIDHLFAPVNDESSTCKTAGINIEDVKPGRLNFKPGCHEVVVFAVTSLGVQAAYEDIAVTQ